MPQQEHLDSSTTENLLNVEQVCKRLSASRSALYRLITAKKIPPAKHIKHIGARWKESDINKFIKENFE
ncbi:helix-turn-helix domain-containing protein [Halomonas sp. MCCC 1A11062]|uniref:helix-turn-helix transcriptional regulator n=1 Tax=Halomonas sp. MCCC 1A11062 TaxID=2733485 RepID=UPI001F297754|nr:helix-turn-helix domain-containing protein [Halomonas sp. MCCC 1A11062]MCE8039274.1 helix-turn-helix domain-containing protein [Halomonas sp. MCCC 1A11062]